MSSIAPLNAGAGSAPTTSQPAASEALAQGANMTQENPAVLDAIENVVAPQLVEEAVKRGADTPEKIVQLLGLGADPQRLQSTPEAFRLQQPVAEKAVEAAQTTADVAMRKGIAAGIASERATRDQPVSSLPGVQRILNRLDQEIETNPELTAIRDRQAQLRSDIFATRESYQQAVDGLGDFKYDPHAAFPSKGAKAAALVSIALGGIGASLTGGENQIFNYFNDVINRELQRQKLESDNLAQKAGALRNLYTMNLELLGNEDAAEKLTLDQIAKSYELEVKAHIADIKNINDRNIAERQLSLSMAKLAAEQDKARQLTDAQINRGDKRDAAARVSKSTAGQLGKALASLDEISKNIKGLNKGDEALGKLDTAMNTLAMSIAQGDSDVSKALLEFIDTNDSFQPYVELASVLRPIAFGLAREGQSASSISNRDVAMFLSILADPVRNLDSIRDSLTFMKQKAERDAVVDNAAAENPRMTRRQVENSLLSQGVIQPSIGLDEYLETKGRKALSQSLTKKFPKVQ